MIEQKKEQVSGAPAAPLPTAETSPQAAQPRKTLGLTGITINAMALIAPGALMWLLYQSQAAGSVDTGANIWPGVLAALLVAMLTARSLGALAHRFPEAGLRGAYHFADPALRELARSGRGDWVPAAKFLLGWSAHLYYWIYPGVMVAFTGVLADYLLRQFGYHPTIFGQLILTFSFSALVGFLALRGITGSTTSSVVLNVIQLAALLAFGAAAIVFRVLNPLHIPADGWAQPNALAVLLPKSLSGLVFQTGLAIILMVGFEDAFVLGASARHPARDVPRAALLALLIQGALAYLFEYFTAGLALNHRLPALGQSPIPIGDLVYQLGNTLIAGNGGAALLVMAFTILIALLGSALTTLNNAVRVSFSMAMDPEMPGVLRLLPERYATPYTTVLLLSGAAALVGSAGALGGLPVLMGIILATNLGAFVLFGLLCALTLATAPEKPARLILAAGLGLLVNLGLAAAFPIFGLRAGGSSAQATTLTLGVALVWLVIVVVQGWLRR